MKAIPSQQKEWILPLLGGGARPSVRQSANAAAALRTVHHGRSTQQHEWQVHPVVGTGPAQ